MATWGCASAKLWWKHCGEILVPIYYLRRKFMWVTIADFSKTLHFSGYLLGPAVKETFNFLISEMLHADSVPSVGLCSTPEQHLHIH